MQKYLYTRYVQEEKVLKSVYFLDLGQILRLLFRLRSKKIHSNLQQLFNLTQKSQNPQKVV